MRALQFLLFACLSTSAYAAEVQNLRMWAAPERTRVVFELDEPPETHTFTMRSPDRLVIDFARTTTAKPLRLPGRDQHRVKSLRYARRGERDLRVVLDLGGTVEVRETLLEPNEQYRYRFVLDLLDPVQMAPASGSVALAAPSAARDVVVAVDAGHGGEDVGAIGPSGAYEKDIAMAVARELAAQINRQEGMRAVLIRDGDYYIGLRGRMERARAHKADLFVSIHANAFRDRRISGSSVYVLSQRGASSEAARWMAEHENASDLIGGVTLDDKDDVLKSVLIDLSQTASLEASIDAASAILSALKQVGKVHKSSVQHAGFVVLKSPDIPSVLVETAYISNPADERKLRSAEYRRRLAQAMFSGIKQYFHAYAAPDTKMAQRSQHRVSGPDIHKVAAQHRDAGPGNLELANHVDGHLLETSAQLEIP